MKQFSLTKIAVVVAALTCLSAPEMIGVGNVVHAQEVNKIVGQASEMYKQRKYREALTKLAEADRVGNKSVADSFTIERMRLAIATASGDTDLMMRSGEAVLSANKLGKNEQLQIVAMLANAYYKAGAYAKAIKMYDRYYAEGGTDGSLRKYQTQAMMQSGDSSKAMASVKAEIEAAEKAGRAPSQAALETYAYTMQKTDKVAYLSALEKLVMYYGKKEYWVNLLNGLRSKGNLASRLSSDVFRLKLAVGQLNGTGEYVEMVQTSIQEGNAGEALRVIEQGYKSGVLGTGNEAARHARLKDMATKKAAEAKAGFDKALKDAEVSSDGGALASLGYSVALNGEYDKGIALIEKGIAKGNIKNPHDATLHLGIAQVLAGKKAAAVKTLKTVGGEDGTADLARFWTIYANQK